MKPGPAEDGKVLGVVYDLDGTLVDSAPDIALAVNTAFAQNSLPQLPVEEVARMVGRGGRNVCRQALRHLGLDYDEADIERIYVDFFNAYKKAPVVRTKPYEGVMDCLRELRERGYKQGICTNKTGLISGLVLDELGMSGYFGTVIGGDDTDSHKPDPSHLHHVCKELGLRADQVAYVGDTVVDLETARAAGVRAYFAVSWADSSAKLDGYSRELASYGQLPSLLGGL